MPGRSIAAAKFRVPLKIPFAHAAARHDRTEALIVCARSGSGQTGFGEGCPRAYVTGETLDGAIAFVARHGLALAADVHGVGDLRAWIEHNEALIDRNPAAFCAIEMALLDLLARERGCSVEALLGLPEPAGTFRYTAVIGDCESAEFVRYFERYWMAGFRDFKVKLSGDRERDYAKIKCLRQRGDGALRLRVDANNLWRRVEDCVEFLSALSYPFFAVEEPLPVHELGAFLEVADALGTGVVLDESLLRIGDLGRIPYATPIWILNCRVSKLGGVLRAMAVVEEARRRGLEVIVGAHVGETSLLAALTVAQRAGTALVAQEGAFGTHLLTHDPWRPLVMFGNAGILRVADDLAAARLGWGLQADDRNLLAD